MRIPLVVGNWKMNTTITEARDLTEALLTALDKISGVEKVLCPPLVSLVTVQEVIRRSSLKLGAQNMYPQEGGAYTGEVSPPMLQGICDYVILGHSERRRHLGETDEFINQKVRAALKGDIRPILCVGETLEEQEAGMTEEVLIRQTTRGLEEIDNPSSLVVTYEPVWAIGTGRSATGTDANAAIGLVRNTLSQIFSPGMAGETRLLYGGSVSPDNIAGLMAEPEIDGVLVGGASLRTADFARIVRIVSEAKG